MATIVLTAARISPAFKNLGAPKVLYLDDTQVVKVKPFKGGSSIYYGAAARFWKKYRVYETPIQVKVATTPVAASVNVYVQEATLALALTGTGQANSVVLPSYLNAIAAGGAAAISNSAKLPSASVYADGTAWSASLNKGARVLINAGSVALSVFPQTGEFINSLAVNIPVTLAIGGRLHFVPAGLSLWKTALETAE